MGGGGFPRAVRGGQDTPRKLDWLHWQKEGVVDVILGWLHTITRWRCKALARWPVIAMSKSIADVVFGSAPKSALVVERVLEQIEDGL